MKFITALESKFRGEGERPNTGKYISIPQTPLEKLEAYKFAYIADRAIKEGRGDQKVILGVGKSALELAMGDMGQYNPHELPKVHRSFRDPDAIKETAEDYSNQWRAAYEEATVGDLLTFYGTNGILEGGIAKVEKAKLKAYEKLTFEQLEKMVHGYEEMLMNQVKRGNGGGKVDERNSSELNAKIYLHREALKMLGNLREKYTRALTEIAGARAAQEYFEDNQRKGWEIMTGPAVEKLGHRLPN